MIQQYCNNTNIPIGTKVRIVKNLGNQCEPFINLIGLATQPFKIGCCKPDWIGVEFIDETIYGRKLNFHKNEIEILDTSVVKDSLTTFIFS